MVTVTIFCLSCSKDGPAKLPIQEDAGCIERIFIRVNDHGIANADVLTINKLFQDSKIDNSQFRYYQYLHDSVQTYFPPYAKFDNKIVKVDQYTNGLRIFRGQMSFLFKNNVYEFTVSEPTKGTDLNTKPRLTTGQLRYLFLGHIEEFDHAGDLYKDSCFKAEFGYFNVNAGIGYAPEKLVKAWRVLPKNANYPLACYQDDDGKFLGYDNGIRYFSNP
jgi:hypothetical protein